MTADLSDVGVVMNRVSTSMRADKPCGGTLSSVKTPVTWGFLSGGRVPVAPGMPMKSAPTPPGVAHTCKALHFPLAMAGRGATAATVSRKATNTESAVARTNRPLREASMPLAGLVENTTPPAGGRVAIAEQGMDTSRACGAPDTRGAVTSPTVPPCGHRMAAVVCFTGMSGVSAHSSTPAMPARTATSRAIRVGSTLGTRVDVRRPGCLLAGKAVMSGFRSVGVCV